ALAAAYRLGNVPLSDPENQGYWRCFELVFLLGWHSLDEFFCCEIYKTKSGEFSCLSAGRYPL
ncbi:MAG: hypothetical protein ACK5FS_08600, partial [Planctomycetota bacterium]